MQKEVLEIKVFKNPKGKYTVNLEIGAEKIDEVSIATSTALVAVSKAILKELDKSNVPVWNEVNVLMAITHNAVKFLEGEKNE